MLSRFDFSKNQEFFSSLLCVSRKSLKKRILQAKANQIRAIILAIGDVMLKKVFRSNEDIVIAFKKCHKKKTLKNISVQQQQLKDC